MGSRRQFRQLHDVSFGKQNTQKDHEKEVFLKNNISYFVLKCTKFYKR